MHSPLESEPCVLLTQAYTLSHAERVLRTQAAHLYNYKNVNRNWVHKRLMLMFRGR